MKPSRIHQYQYQLRRACAADAAPLATLAENTFRDAFGADNRLEDMNEHCARCFGEAQQTAEIAAPHLETWLCSDNEQLIGFVQLRSLPAPAAVVANNPLEIQRFYVEKQWHGGGVARQLMELSLIRARKRLCDVIWLGVWERNPRAIAFYAKYGFREVGEHSFHLGSDLQKDLLLARELRES